MLPIYSKVSVFKRKNLDVSFVFLKKYIFRGFLWFLIFLKYNKTQVGFFMPTQIRFHINNIIKLFGSIPYFFACQALSIILMCSEVTFYTNMSCFGDFLGPYIR